MGVDIFCPVFQCPDDPVNPVKIIKKQHILKLTGLLQFSHLIVFFEKNDTMT